MIRGGGACLHEWVRTRLARFSRAFAIRQTSADADRGYRPRCFYDSIGTFPVSSAPKIPHSIGLPPWAVATVGGNVRGSSCEFRFASQTRIQPHQPRAAVGHAAGHAGRTVPPRRSTCRHCGSHGTIHAMRPDDRQLLPGRTRGKPRPLSHPRSAKKQHQNGLPARYHRDPLTSGA